MQISIPNLGIEAFTYIVEKKLSSKNIASINLEVIYFNELEELKVAKSDEERNSLETLYDIPWDTSQLEELSTKYEVHNVFFMHLAILYYKINDFPDHYIEAEKSFYNDYFEDMVKIRQLLKNVNSESQLFVKLNSENEKINNKNGWFTQLLSKFINDYVAEDETYHSAIRKEIGRPKVEAHKKYFQYLFFTILSIEREDNVITNDLLRCLKEFMEILGFTFNLNHRTENEYLKIMRTEILEILKNGIKYEPIYIPKYYDEINYIRRITALKSGTTYTSIDDVERYKSDSELLQKSGLYDFSVEDGPEKLNRTLNELYQLGYNLHNPEVNPLVIKR